MTTTTNPSQPMEYLRASVKTETDSFNDEEQTLTAVVGAHGFTFKRYRWDLGGEVEIRLNLHDGLDLSRVEEGAAPLLLDHEDHIGITHSMQMVGDELQADVQFSREEPGGSTYRKFKEGTMKKFSIGYAAGKLTLIKTDEETGLRTFEASSIKIFEVTATGMPENIKTQTLSAGAEGEDRIIQHSLTIVGIDQMGSRIQSPQNAQTPPSSTAAAPPAGALAPQGEEGQTRDLLSADMILKIRAEETERQSFLHSMKEKHSLPSEFIDKLTLDGTNKTDSSALILDYLSSSQAPAPKTSGISVTRDEGDKEILSATDALVARYLSRPLKLTKLSQGNPFEGQSMMSVFAHFYEKHGGRVRFGQENEMYQHFQAMKEFPVILGNFASRLLLEGYETPDKTFLPFVRVKEVKNFGTNLKARPARAPRLLPVLEDGTVQKGILSADETVEYSIRNYSRIIGITRPAIVTDDLGHFTDTVFAFGAQAAQLEAELVFAQLINNPIMGDGLPLFDPAHNNIGKGEPIGEAGLQAARLAMRLQRDQDGNRLNISPRVLIVGATLETQAEKWTYSPMNPVRPEDVNPFQRTMERVVDSIMDENPDTWFVATGGGMNPVVELAYLQGQRRPYIMKDSSDIQVDGTRFRYGLDVGARAIDWRGVWTNKLPAEEIVDPAELPDDAELADEVVRPRRQPAPSANKKVSKKKTRTTTRTGEGDEPEDEE
ncbi:MAG: hypothetical protein EOP10_23485 [Proteobacteria bacterium]|nr:MAG: hypothetical protein EOP10_23485 [Pseudomonadota bacterium]